MISVEYIVKDYFEDGASTRALDGVSFAIAPGECIAIMGPSGSGKSTLLNILSFLDRPTAGHYRFRGREMEELSDDELARIRNREMGFVFQAFNLMSRASVEENVELPLLYAADVAPAERRERMTRAIAAVGLSEKIRTEAGRLSGGEKQRVAIARALVNDPAVIFADEPTGNLDSATGRQILEVLRNLNAAGRTIVLVTHDAGAAAMARRLIRLRDGRVESDGPIAAGVIAATR